MTVQALYTAATGMEAMESKLDVIANNMANVSTIGFKKDRANFEDLFYRHEILPGSELTNPSTAIGKNIGLGTRVSGVQTSFVQGSFEQTNRPLDVAIVGNGFFQVQDANGQTLYSRAGNFSINNQGELVLGSANVGRRLLPQLTVPPDWEDIRVGEDGVISVKQRGQTTFQQLGQLQLVVFQNQEGLMKVGDNMYTLTDASGAAIETNPGLQGAGVLRQGMLEASNVEPVKELIDLIQTQRNFELNSQVVQAGDQVMQIISNLRR